jgi:dTMP kinase
MARGFLIALEGIDGAGKSTQARLLAQALAARGYGVCLTREPSDGPQGKELRRYLGGGRRHLSPDQELALFMADRREQVGRVVAPALAAGKVVVTDRSYYSSAAYQGALGLAVEAIIAANEAFAPRPDLVFLLQLPVDQALRRCRQGGRHTLQVSETREYLERVSAIYDTFKAPQVRRVDARGSAEDVHRQVVAITLAALHEAGINPSAPAE